MKIEKIADHNFVVKNDEGVVVYKARSRKACTSHIENIAAYESITRDIVPITNHRICPNRQTVCVPKGCEIVPSTKKSIRTEILAAISEMVDDQELKKNAMLVLTNQFTGIKKSTLQTYFSDCFNEKYTPFKTKYIGVSSEGRLFWIA